MNKDHWAIVVSISKYPNIGSLEFTHSDAVKFVEWLESPDGGDLPKENIYKVFGPDYSASVNFNDYVPPYYHEIEKAFEEVNCLDESFKGKRLYFYFAGHATAPIVEEICLLMANAATNRNSQCLDLNRTLSWFDKNRIFEEVIFILDCCRSTSIDESMLTRNFISYRRNNCGDQPDYKYTKVVATTHGHSAYEWDEGGIFTKALLEHLQGKGEYPDGNITTKTLDEYLIKRVDELAKQKGKRQFSGVQPKPNSENVILLFRIPDENIPRTTLQIFPSKKIAGDLILYDDKGNEITRKSASGCSVRNPWKVELKKNTKYTLVSNAYPLPKVITMDEYSGAGPYKYKYEIK